MRLRLTITNSTQGLLTKFSDFMHHVNESLFGDPEIHGLEPTIIMPEVNSPPATLLPLAHARISKNVNQKTVDLQMMKTQVFPEFIRQRITNLNPSQ